MVYLISIAALCTYCRCYLCIGVGTGGALGACAPPPPIFWVTITNIIPVPPQSDKIGCRLLEGIKVPFKQPLKVS